MSLLLFEQRPLPFELRSRDQLLSVPVLSGVLAVKLGADQVEDSFFMAQAAL